MTQGVEPRVIAGRYAMTGELGRGGMGVVWRATDRVIGREVAVKELRLPAGSAAGEQAVLAERVLREARAAGRLNDPAVVTVHDVVIENDVPFIVMELVSAPTLADVVARSGPLPPEQVADLAGQVLAALECAHAEGVVHRDVKPANLMLLPNGRVKLADFGIAQAVDDPTVTVSGTIVGSPAFIAPERIRGDAAAPASDLWSLGATLFYAVEGWSPFERRSTAATLHAVVNDAPQLVRCPEPLASAVTGLLITEPGARLTGEQVRALLRRATLPVVAGPGVATALTRMDVNPADLTGPGDLRGSGGSGDLGRPAGPGGPTQWLQPAPPVRRARGRRGLVTVGAIVAAVVLFGGGILVGRLALGGSEPGGPGTTFTYGAGGQLPIFAPALKAPSLVCLDGRPAEGTRYPASAATDCGAPHDAEVIGFACVLNDYGDGKGRPDYPGMDALTACDESLCGIIFDSGWVDYRDKATALEWAAVVPTERQWDEHPATGGNYSVAPGLCIVWRTDGDELTESVLRDVG